MVFTLAESTGAELPSALLTSAVSWKWTSPSGIELRRKRWRAFPGSRVCSGGLQRIIAAMPAGKTLGAI